MAGKRFRVGLLGGGSWGTTVAALLTRNADVTLWARSADTVSEINESHTNEKFLPDARLPEVLTATCSIAEVVRDADLIVMGIPSHAYRAVLELAEEYEVEMPIATEVYRVVHEGQTPREAYRGLLRLPVASEAEPG